VSHCVERRNWTTNQSCFRESCAASNQNTPGINNFGFGFDYPDEPGYYFYILVTANSGLDPPDPTLYPFLVEMLRQNNGTSIDPLVPPAQPLTVTHLWTPANIGDNLTLSSKRFGQTVFVAGWNWRWSSGPATPDDIEAEVDYALENAVYVPSRCPDTRLADIPWLLGNDIQFNDMMTMVQWMIGVNWSAVNTSNWIAECVYWLGEFEYCALFPSYYSFASLTDYDVTPSPWYDLYVMAEVTNAEFLDCGPPVGCLGMWPEPP